MQNFVDEHRNLKDSMESLRKQYFAVYNQKEPKRLALLTYKNRIRELVAQKEDLEQEIGTALESQLTAGEEQTVKDLRVSDKKQLIRDERMITEKSGEDEAGTAECDEETHGFGTSQDCYREFVEEEAVQDERKFSICKLVFFRITSKRICRFSYTVFLQRVDDISDNERRHKLENATAAYTSLVAKMEANRQQLETVSTELDEYVESKNTLERKIENQMEQQRDYEQQQRDCQKAFDKIAVKEEAVKQKREDSLKKMRQLGALPTDTFSKWQNVKQRDLEKKLIECVNDLKKYENVNKKALDQYMTASTQKEELTKRMGEQKKSEDSIEELLKVLETRKYEAIQMTFKQVKKNFEQVFKQLVPHGQ